MIALLAGSRLASHTLTLTEGSDRFLPEIFPRVDDIDRFNLVTDRAKALLNDADQHVAAVSVPYGLSIHEDFVITVIEMLRSSGTQVPVPGKRKLGPATMHEALFNATGHSYSATSLELFHVLREMRNSQIHEGGRANPRLLKQLATMSANAAGLWQRIVLEPHTSAVAGGRVSFSVGHLYLVFAITKSLAREVNFALQAHWPRHVWGALLIRDYEVESSKARNSSSWRRSLVGFARLDYAPLGLRESEIEAAARASGAWTVPSWA